MDMERVTLLRNKAFNMWTMDDKEEQRSEWQKYNDIIATMQAKLVELHGKVK